MGRTCTICKHPQASAVSKAISKGESFRGIAGRFSLSKSAVERHTANCLSYSFAAFIEKSKEKQVIDVYAEFLENLSFARELRTAAREYLADPIDPLRLMIIPRSDEIDVVYYESAMKSEQEVGGDALNQSGTRPNKPEKKSAKLSALLMGVETLRNIEVDKVNIKHVDLRSFALDAIKTADSCVDKFAKLGGLYQQDQDNLHDKELKELKLRIEARAAQKGIPYWTELENYLSNYSGTLKPEIRERLVSEAVN